MPIALDFPIPPRAFVSKLDDLVTTSSKCVAAAVLGGIIPVPTRVKVCPIDRVQ